MDLVKAYWTRAFAGQTATKWTLTGANGQPFATVDALWRRALHDGFLIGTSALAAATPTPTPAAPAAQRALPLRCHRRRARRRPRR